MKSIQDKDLNLSKKTILIRLDLNVPIKEKNIIDTNRIDKIIPTLKFLIDKNAKLIILSHIGRPKGKVIKDLSLKPVCDDLIKKLGQNINLIDQKIKKLIMKTFLLSKIK